MSTVTVELFGALAAQAGGATRVEVEATNIRELYAALAEKFPGMAPQLDRGVSVSIDGRIYTEAWFEEVTPESEIVLLPRIAGG